MKLLKASVIIMGILILVGLTVLVVEVIRRHGAEGEAAPASPVAAAPVERGFGNRDISIPRGAEAVETRIDGDRALVRLKLADGNQAILIIDIATGDRLGLIRLEPR
jgi:hypothetical protein